MKVDKLHYRKVINSARHLEYYSIRYIQSSSDQSNLEKINEELDYLIKNDIYHKIARTSRKSFLGDQIIIRKNLEQDFKLLEKYITFFDQHEIWKTFLSKCATPPREWLFKFKLLYIFSEINVININCNARKKLEIMKRPTFIY